MWGGRPWTGVEYVAELVGRLWADSVGAAVHREGYSDLDAGCHGFLKPPTLVSRFMVDLVVSAYGLDDLGSEVLPQRQDSSISGVTKLNSLAKDRRHSTNKNRDDGEQLHR